MLKALKTLLLTVLGIVLFAIPGFAYDEAYDINHDQIKYTLPIENELELRFTFPMINAYGTAWAAVPDKKPGTWKKEYVSWGQAGSGTVIFHGYVLTAAHVVLPHSVGVPMDKWSRVNTCPIKMDKRQIFLRIDSTLVIPAWVHYINEVDDIAILAYVPSNVLEPLDMNEFRIAFDPTKMHHGDAVLIMQHKRENGHMTCDLEPIYGMLESSDPEVPHDSMLSMLRPNDFTITFMPAIPGDSGSAIFMFEDGVPVLVGWLHSGYVEYPMIWTWGGFIADFERFFHVS